VKSILVVCEGNICRSPMAQALLSAALPQVNVRSAGLGALVGCPADRTAVSLMSSRGLDITGHRAVQMTSEMCVSADIILVMEHGQRVRIEQTYPELRGKIFRIGEYTKQDILDPYRLEEKAFTLALARIEAGLREWLYRLERI
jgi:protein-tyrosine phosphatase